MAETTFEAARTAKEREVDFILKQNVERGIARLRKEWGGDDWVDHIDPQTLILSDCNECVLGQVYREEGEGDENYGDGYSYGIELFDFQTGDSIEHGFTIKNPSDDAQWSRLNDIWLEKIEQIRAD